MVVTAGLLPFVMNDLKQSEGSNNRTAQIFCAVRCWGFFLYRCGLDRFEKIASKRRGHLRFDDPFKRMSWLERCDLSRDFQARWTCRVFAKVQPAFLRTEFLSIDVKLER